MKERAAWLVAHNWRIQKRLPRVTAHAIKVGYINEAGPDAVTVEDPDLYQKYYFHLKEQDEKLRHQKFLKDLHS